MKKLLTILCAVLISFQMFGQVSANIGYLSSTYKFNEDGFNVSMNGSGIYAGVSTDIYSTNFNDFSFSPGFYADFVDYELFSGLNAIVYYVRVPLHVKYNYPMSNTADLFISAGPSAVLGLGGKAKMSYGGVTYTENFFEEGDRRFDATFGFEAGVNLNKAVRVSCGYDLGLVNQVDDIDGSAKRNTFHLGIGYLF